jgi:hypothetical protein
MQGATGDGKLIWTDKGAEFSDFLPPETASGPKTPNRAAFLVERVEKTSNHKKTGRSRFSKVSRETMTVPRV